MTKLPDQIRFVDGPASGYMAGWTGPWPPPETFTVAVGRETRMVKVVGDHVDAALMFQLRQVADVSTYRLRNASQLPDDFESEHVFRGAEYVVEAVAA